ncbi:DNA repair protein RAD50 [Cryptosporidium felis]|nr:DNA repair protein RAD50 [Cryptosporidium felis]
MSILEKLIISGIRSFSPNRREGIAFETPITLIVGQNGSGKTTIIECLKASITGELPPNSKSGQYFIHDPKLLDSAEVRAQIRLLFREYQNQKKVQVVRSFQLSHIKSRKSTSGIYGEVKPQFKVIETVLQTKDETSGEITSISHKCADINIQVPNLFGVSNSIIENVLFCHQEDSNWPLQEMAKVKKKFDELFGSSRYSKALENITKIKSEYNKKMKEKILQNENIKQKLDFFGSIINKKNECISRKEKIKGEIFSINSKLSELVELRKSRMNIKEKLDELINDYLLESKILDSRLSEIKEIENEVSNSSLRQEYEFMNISDKIIHEEKNINVLNSHIEGIKNEINYLQQKLIGYNENKSVEDFNCRLTELHRKILDIKCIATSKEVEIFFERSQIILNKKLVDYESINWDILFNDISKMDFEGSTEMKSALSELKGIFDIKLEEKKVITESLKNKREHLNSVKQEFEKISTQISEKKNIAMELDHLSSEIQSRENSADKTKVDNAYLNNLYDCTYNLGKLDGEISTIENIGKYRHFDHLCQNKDPLFTEETIEQKKSEFSSKRDSTLKYWKEVKAYLNDQIFKYNDYSLLKIQHSKLLENLEKYPMNLEEQLINLKEQLTQIESIDIVNIENNLEILELDLQELTKNIQNMTLDIKSLDNELNCKKLYLKNSCLILKQEFDYIFSNRDYFNIPNETSNKELLQAIVTKQEEDKNLKNKHQELSDYINQLKKIEKLKRKQEHCDASKKLMKSKVIEIFGLFNISHEQYSTNGVIKEKLQELQQNKKIELENLQGEIEKLQCELSKLEGELSVNEDWLKKCISDLKGNSNIEELSEKYNCGIFEQKVINSCIKDMEKYHSSLQKSLMKFHVNKMIEINRTIRELWNITYRGHDIDYIAIRSDAESNDDDEDTTLNKNSRMPSGTKSFNYRVVMIQNGVELDMKGRCSAGQRVLACIIIRLALAESFCVNCGIITLDEPTTNLDRFNIEGLAEALSHLIHFRKQQSNFQLIIITHDERFVRIMAQAQKCDHFFQVSKDDDGYSVIRQIDFNGY